MIDFLSALTLILIIANLTGYVLVVLKEKYYLKNNIIVIDNKYINQDDLEEADLQEFFLDGLRIRAGDEVQILTKTKNKLKGTVLGIIVEEDKLKMVTYKNSIIKLNIDSIKDFKVISKYGKFLS